MVWDVKEMTFRQCRNKAEGAMCNHHFSPTKGLQVNRISADELVRRANVWHRNKINPPVRVRYESQPNPMVGMEITPKQLKYILDLIKIHVLTDDQVNVIKNKLFTEDRYWAHRTINKLIDTRRK